MNATNMSDIKMLEFDKIGDPRGYTVIAEGGKEIPFEIKRIFYIFGTKKEIVRGCHANRESEFVLINVVGSSKVKVKDGLGNEAIFLLNRPHTGLYLPTMVWKEMYDFSEDSVLLVLSNKNYNPDEYIRDYSKYEKEVRGKSNG